tara:strand:+ start:1932 stop:2264 length:333 start_codon:yes stop_codon:yes gene_type:complete
MATFYKAKYTNNTPVQVIGPTTLTDGTVHHGNPYQHPDKYVFTNVGATTASFSLYYKITSGTIYYLTYKQVLPIGNTLTFTSDEICYDADGHGLWIKADSGSIDVTIKMK